MQRRRGRRRGRPGQDARRRSGRRRTPTAGAAASSPGVPAGRRGRGRSRRPGRPSSAASSKSWVTSRVGTPAAASVRGELARCVRPGARRRARTAARRGAAPRLDRQRPGQRDALALAARERPRALVGAGASPKRPSSSSARRAARRGRAPRSGRRRCAQAREVAGTARSPGTRSRSAAARAAGRRPRRCRSQLAVAARPGPARRQQPGDDAQHRGLAGARGSDQGQAARPPRSSSERSSSSAPAARAATAVKRQARPYRPPARDELHRSEQRAPRPRPAPPRAPARR